MANDSAQKISQPSNSQVSQALRDLFNTVKLFNGFPPELVDELAQAAQFVDCVPEQIILRQNEMNSRLYFLLVGRVDIIVDDGLVATLRRRGDILGEMSVITNKPCTATIMAATPVQLIAIDIDRLRQITSGSLHFDHVLYRIYSTILSDKLNITNQRAKKLEETTEALQKAKTELQDSNTQLEKRVIERTQELQLKFSVFLNQHLKNLKTSLTDATQKVDKSLQNILRSGLDEVVNMIQFIEPLVQMFNLEVSLKSKKILLAQGDRKSQTVSKLALGGTGIQMEVLSSPEDGDKVLSQNKFDLILVDEKSQSMIPQSLSSEATVPYLFMSLQSSSDQLGQLSQLKRIPNFIFIDDSDRSMTMQLLSTAVTKLASQKIFGLGRYLREGYESNEAAYQKSDDRKDLISAVKEKFSKLGIRSTVLDTVGGVLEEMLMNAIYDAPVDSTGEALYNKLDRKNPVFLKTSEQGILRYACDGRHLAVSVEDPFGALRPQILLSYLQSCYQGQAGSLQNGKGGAGRGLHQIVENSEVVIFNVQPKIKTEVIALFNMVPGDKSEKKPQIQYFSA